MSIEPGTVLIVLAGPYRGKRVVFLRELPSGLLLVTGPYKINGVPLRRINRAYVIKTSTKLDVSAVKLDKISDATFKKPKATKKSGKKTEAEFFAQGEKKKVLPAEFVAEQKSVDAAIMGKMKKDGIMVRYLRARFTLSNGVFPHELKF
jgi:large subunit ribosomal protein L6e